VIGIFKQKTPANILVLLIFGLLIKLPMFAKAHVPVIQEKDGILFQALLRLMKPAGNATPTIYPLLAFLLLFTQAITLNRILNNDRMMHRSNFLTGMSYLLITSFFPEWNYFSAPLLVNTIMIFVLAGLFSIYNQQKAKGTIFNIGLGIGIASFIFFPSIGFILWVLFGLLIMRPLRVNEWLLCLLGVTTPYYFYAIYLFLGGGYKWAKLMPHLSVHLPSLQESIWLAGSSLLLIFPFITGGYYVQDNLRRMLIQVRKGWSLILSYLLVAIFLPLINTTLSFENWLIAAVPFAAFHACSYFYPPKKTFPLIVFWTSVAFVLAYQYLGPRWT
jgi:hypothetical protein